MKTKAIFFDAVGTLIHPEPPASAVYHEVGRRHGSQLDVGSISARFLAAFQAEEIIDISAGFVTSEKREVERWYSIVAEVLDDVDDLDACFAELYAHFARPDAWRCDAHAGEVLATLSARGHRLGLASNYDFRLRGVLAGLPQLAPLQDVVISAEIGWRKPALEFFAHLCTSVGLLPHELLYVGDDVTNDFEGARGAGIPALLLDPRRRWKSLGKDRVERIAQVLDRV